MTSAISSLADNTESLGPEADYTCIDGHLLPVLVDVNDASRLLAISTRQVWRLVQAGALPQPLHIGRLSRWRVIDLLGYVETLREQSAARDHVVIFPLPAFSSRRGWLLRGPFLFEL